MFPAKPSAYPRLRPWTAPHWTALGVAALTSGGFVAAARYAKGCSWEAKLRKAWGWTHLAAGTAWTVASLDPKQFDIKESLPLHLCDVLRPILALGLITENEHALNLSHYWGIVLNPQAIITPDVIYYYHPRWVRDFTYWFFHITALATPLALTFGSGYRPTWKGYREAMVITPAWVAVTMGINYMTEGNYGFLSHAPGSPSIIDKLGPWPYYIGAEAVAVALAWAAMTAALPACGRQVGPAGLLRKG